MLLRNIWYYALASRRLAPKRVIAKTILGEPMIFGRTADGVPFALRDICPHRAMPLSAGSFDGLEIECCYHGWRFDRDGRCTAVPSLVDGQKLEFTKIRVAAYPIREIQGNIWVYLSAESGSAQYQPPPPEIDGLDGRAPDLVETIQFPCHIDHAVVGLMDPAHGPFVHNAWWWRGRRSAHAKEKAFGPSPLGFTMLKHRPSKNSAAYRLLGGIPETEIRFMLPGIRIERVQAGRHLLCGLTATTPIDDRTTEVNHVIWWTMPWLSALRPILRPFARAFLGQDRDIVARQQAGLAFDPPLMLIDDADTQAKWYYRLKNDYARAVEKDEPFVNPIRAATLRWRS